MFGLSGELITKGNESGHCKETAEEIRVLTFRAFDLRQNE